MFFFVPNWRRLLPLLIVFVGVCAIGYGVWSFLDFANDDRAGGGVSVAADLDRLKALGVKVGQLPGFPVQKLDFSGTTVTDNDLAVLAHLPELDQIDLSNTSISDNGLVHLRRLSKLQVLRLNNTMVTDRGLANIEGCPELFMLHLMDTCVELASVKLATLPGIRIIDATGSPVGDLGMANICSATGLTGLGLRKTKITDNELARLQQLARLQVLNLGGTLVSDRGMTILRSIEVPSLRSLVLSECTFTSNGLSDLAKLKINHLNLSGSRIAFPDTIKELGRSETLTELIIDRTAVKDDDLKDFAQGFPQLTSFQASGTAISDAGLEYLGNHPTLKLLVLYDTNISREGVERFRAAHPRIEVRHGKH